MKGIILCTMKKFVLTLVLTVLFVACGSDDKGLDPIEMPDDTIVSSMESSCSSAKSSSSKKSKGGKSTDSSNASMSSSVKVSSSSAKSSSSKEPKGGESTDSSGASMSSSTGITSSSEKSSSSVKSSSGSTTLATLCKTKDEDNCEYGTLIDERDGQIYKTVKIGNQWWMAENLNYAYLQPTSTEDSSSFCYNDSLQYCKKRGRLYMWSAAMDSAGVIPGNEANRCGYDRGCLLEFPVRGVCPRGWHLPTDKEWKTLFGAVGGQGDAGKVLKSTSGWQGRGGKYVTDAVGFSVLPGGYRNGEGDFFLEESAAFFWCSTFLISTMANLIEVDDFLFAGPSSDSMFFAYSVRCVMDDSSMMPPPPCKTEVEDNCEYGTLIDERDDQIYKTVKIGNQWWMAENLNYAYLQPTSTEDSSSFCYDNMPEYCEKYGRLYLRSAALDVCPNGWHLPTEQDWSTLTGAEGIKPFGGKRLKSTSGWASAFNEAAKGTDGFGFSALPGGYRVYYGTYYEEGGEANFWNASDEKCNILLGFDWETVRKKCISPGDDAYSVRCMKDED